MRRMTRAIAALMLMATLHPLAAHAADPQDPEWPCIQRRIATMTLGQVWAGPVPDAATEARAADPAIQRLAQVLELRRTPLPEAEALIADFARTAPPEDLTALFLATFTRIDRARSAIVAGIGRYARRQAALDDQIDMRRNEMSALLAAQSPDFDRIDALEEALDWDTRIFIERQQSLIYVCETPVILEQRAFALGRAVMAHLPR